MLAGLAASAGVAIVGFALGLSGGTTGTIAAAVCAIVAPATYLWLTNRRGPDDSTR